MGFTLLNPVHLLFINLVTDCFPALALAILVIPIVEVVKAVQRKLGKYDPKSQYLMQKCDILNG